MEPRKLSPITIGIAGAAGTSGIGIVVSRLPTGQGNVMVTCLVLAMSFTVTSLTAVLGLILNYRLGKLALHAQASALQRSADMRITRMELQRVILDKIQDGTKAAHAYREMTAVDALSRPNLVTDGSCDPNQLLRKVIQARADNRSS
jgi:hypothetical protein